MMEYFKGFSSANYINEEEYKETYKLVHRWRKYPPISVYNILRAKMSNCWSNIFKRVLW